MQALTPSIRRPLNLQLNTKFVPGCDTVNQRFSERCGHESGSKGDCAAPAACFGRCTDGCASDSWSDGASAVPAGQKRELDGSLCGARNCGSTSMADSGHSGAFGTVGGGKGTRPGGRTPCGSRSPPAVFAIPQEGQPSKTHSIR